MKFSAILLMLFIIVPLIEIMLFIKVGGLIGLGATIALVIITAFLGVALLKQQGFATLNRAQESMRQNVFPAYELVEGLILLFCAGLLLTPGFLTDAIGFALLVPHLRKAVAVLVVRYGKSSAGFVMMGASGQREPSGEGGDVFEGEFRRDDEPAGPAEGLDNNSNKEN